MDPIERCKHFTAMMLGQYVLQYEIQKSFFFFFFLCLSLWMSACIVIFMHKYLRNNSLWCHSHVHSWCVNTCMCETIRWLCSCVQCLTSDFNSPKQILRLYAFAFLLMFFFFAVTKQKQSTWTRRMNDKFVYPDAMNYSQYSMFLLIFFFSKDIFERLF